MLLPLFQPLSGALGVPYAPDEETRIEENPPRFTWMPACLEGGSYELQISVSPEFTSDTTLTYGPIPFNLFTPDRPLPHGLFHWRYALIGEDESLSEWSVVRSFVIHESLPLTPLPSRSDRYTSVSQAHPRLWLQAEQLDSFP